MTDRPIVPGPILYHDSCLECGLPFSAVSHAALESAVQDHVAHVNKHADRATDPHFAINRMNKLILPDAWPR